MEIIKIATRRSLLARWQARFIAERLIEVDKSVRVEFVEILTKGDKWLDGPLYELGGKGLFIKELEMALIDGRADIAVHSVKDIPAKISSDFILPILGYRDSCHDILVGCSSLAGLKQGAKVGSASLRRKTQLQAIRPDLNIQTVRGNVDSRLRKLDAGEFDALILAEAGLRRLEIQRDESYVLPVDLCLPAPGQGALGVQALRTSPKLGILEALYDKSSYLCSEAERLVSAGLDADCSFPIGALATYTGGVINLRALLSDSTGDTIIRAEGSGSDKNEVVESVLASLFSKGAQRILDDLKTQF